MAFVTQDTGAPRIFASPLARRLAKEGGLDLSALQGSGPHGRIIERDVKSALARGETAKAAPLAVAPSADATRKFFEAGYLRGNSA